MKKQLLHALGGVILTAVASSAMAIPALQLGNGSTGTWNYDTATDTWVTGSNPFSLIATANATTGSGDYAWETAGAATQTAYLIFAGVPGVNVADGFDITVSNDGGTLTLYTSGYGTPPIEDPNSLSPHGIYDSYYEIYEFNYDGAVGTISDTQPGGTGTGDGFTETFDVTVNSLAAGITGIHADLFTVSGDGILILGSAADRGLVNAFAPFSHDAEYDPNPDPDPDPDPMPVPGTVALFGLGMLGLVWARRRKLVA